MAGDVVVGSSQAKVKFFVDYFFVISCGGFCPIVVMLLKFCVIAAAAGCVYVCVEQEGGGATPGTVCVREVQRQSSLIFEK